MTVLHMAASTNDIQLMDFVISNIENKNEMVNQKNGEGWSAIHFSAFLNNFDSTNLLLENGADLLDTNGQ
jgi:ankyrin repeat protein